MKFANLFISNPNVFIPKLEKDFCSKRVITTSWIDGVKLRDREILEQNNLLPASFIRTCVISGLQQLFEHGYFHADPHPGNILAMEDGRLCYLDFGMMSDLSLIHI